MTESSTVSNPVGYEITVDTGALIESSHENLSSAAHSHGFSVSGDLFPNLSYEQCLPPRKRYRNLKTTDNNNDCASLNAGTSRVAAHVPASQNCSNSFSGFGVVGNSFEKGSTYKDPLIFIQKRIEEVKQMPNEKFVCNKVVNERSSNNKERLSSVGKEFIGVMHFPPAARKKFLKIN